MILKHKVSGKLVEIIDLEELTSPYTKELVGCLQWQEALPDPKCFLKIELCFPSGEELPACWHDEKQYEGEFMDYYHSASSADLSDQEFELLFQK